MHAVLKRRYGQNFLFDKNIINKISKLIPSSDLNILEIGPGDGKLTEHILNHNPKFLTLVEIDHDLVTILETKYKSIKNILIINEDILKYDFKNYFELIISNLPYNISSQILVQICILKNLPKNLILMFQKEFADRLLEKKLNSLNSLVSCFYNIEKKFDVSKNSFKPIPKVNSTVLLFDKKDFSLLNKDEIEKFIQFKRVLFSHKRKTIRSHLKNYKLNDLDIDLSKRVESLDLNTLIKIFRVINT